MTDLVEFLVFSVQKFFWKIYRKSLLSPDLL